MDPHRQPKPAAATRQTDGVAAALNAITLGAQPRSDGSCDFRVWAPKAHKPRIHVLGPRPGLFPLQPEEHGFYHVRAPGVTAGATYTIELNRTTHRPDPASRSQPNGVHQPSAVVDLGGFPWTDQGWRGLTWPDHVFYELHVGTFTPEGTLAAAAARIPYLRALGITAIELMPLAEFPGTRNWGYDGVHPFAVHHAYGGPLALQSFVDTAHQHGLAVYLDVVYNHLGPEGNYLADFGPYFTNRYRTPWGPALNFDGPDSDPVRQFFIENALGWQTHFHLDGLRLDAIHAIRDFSAVTFLEDLVAACRRQADSLGQPFRLVGESDLNLARHILPPERGGFGLDAQWSDDFHHGLHVLLTGEQAGYYADYGTVARFADTWRQGYAYTGQFSAHRRHRHGSSPHLNPPQQFVVCSQNHDQIGNRKHGERLPQLIGFEAQKLAAATTLLSPFIPLLFMGEEYGETAPFLYFVSHTDPALVQAVREGRRTEFAAFGWTGEVPDPQDPATFLQCVLDPNPLRRTPNRELHALYCELLALRRALPAISRAAKEAITPHALDTPPLLLVHQQHPPDAVLLLFHFGAQAVTTPIPVPFPPGTWSLRLDTSNPRWLGPGSSLPNRVQGGRSVPMMLPAHLGALYHQSTPS